MIIKYTCCACGGKFYAKWSDEEAEKEMLLLWGDLKQDDRALVCDNCFKKHRDAALSEFHKDKTAS